MRRIEVPRDTPTEFKLEDTAADIQKRRVNIEIGRRQRNKQREEREGGGAGG